MFSRSSLLRYAPLLVAAVLSGCASTARLPYNSAEGASAEIPGIPDARMWADDADKLSSGMRDHKPGRGNTITLLALSGGGAEGAYGAGFLSCWSGSGGRPEFSVVTGVSVGALIAPFAFLGPAYDEHLARMFTSGDTEGLLQFAGLSGVFGTGLFKEEPLTRLVDAYVTDDLLEAVAAETELGRQLMVVTTNLDTQRTAIWNMGAIATSKHPRALELFKSVLLASASIPGVFPPELIEVEANGRRFAEMHVDGGITSNILLVPDAVLTSRSVPSGRAEIYAIVNGKIGPSFDLVEPGLLPIFQRSFETTIKANTRNGLLASTEYIRERGWNLNLTAIPESEEGLSPTDFDIAEMTRLFAIGCDSATNDPWRTL